MKRILLLTLMLLTISLAAPAAHADSIIITLDTPVQTANPGDTAIYFFGTITADANNSGGLYLSDSYSVDSPFSVDDSGFNFLFSYFIYPGDSPYNLLFSINLPGNQANGVYLGSFSLTGGSDPSSTDPLGSVNFEIDSIGAAPATAPEPSSLFLLGTGMIGVAAGSLRKLRST